MVARSEELKKNAPSDDIFDHFPDAFDEEEEETESGLETRDPSSGQQKRIKAQANRRGSEPKLIKPTKSTNVTLNSTIPYN